MIIFGCFRIFFKIKEKLPNEHVRCCIQNPSTTCYSVTSKMWGDKFLATSKLVYFVFTMQLCGLGFGPIVYLFVSGTFHWETTENK